jgi:hypothetical protein
LWYQAIWTILAAIDHPYRNISTLCRAATDKLTGGQPHD